MRSYFNWWIIIMQAVLQTAVPPLHPLDSIIKCSKQTNKNTCKDTSCTSCSPLQVSVRIADRSPRESRVWSRTESPKIVDRRSGIADRLALLCWDRCVNVASGSERESQPESYPNVSEQGIPWKARSSKSFRI